MISNEKVDTTNLLNFSISTSLVLVVSPYEVAFEKIEFAV